MRGRPGPPTQLLYSIDIESRIRPHHPLRPLKKRVDAILCSMDELFEQAFHRDGRPGVPPERLLKAMLLMALYSVRSERQLCERIRTDLLFRWILDMSPEEDAFDPTVFTHNRPRMDQFGITGAFFDAVLAQAIGAGLCSDDHFSVDGTIIESYASMKSFRPRDESPDDSSGDSNSFKPRNPDVDFHGEKRSNKTLSSRTDPEAKLYRKGLGKPSQLAHLGHVLSENRNGLIVETCVTEASGTAERDAAMEMVADYKRKQGRVPKTVGADAGYDAGEFLIRLEKEGITPHVAMTSKEPADAKKARADRKSLIEARLRMQARQQTVEYEVSQRVRKRVEECFGWTKAIAGLGRSRWVGRWKLKQYFDVAASAYNLLRLTKLQPS
ncbi:IS5 family transposase [Rhodopirellula sallentina]|uniref:Transposase IS4 family protein n=1 Tax=Rhodopirellula sallentina SM41 TaxID=1263870 RepID=M5U6N3_9BACT|nr:IS5 family transposase [Rhodopirellula sallentina]EMI57095.1 transposase IS4 family protein [Rhodopirellula sallentina SM41]